MRPPSTDFDAWILFARRHGLGVWAALALESLEPLAVLGVQASYLMEPVLGPSAAGALRLLLEDDDRRAEFGRRLRDEVGGQLPGSGG